MIDDHSLFQHWHYIPLSLFSFLICSLTSQVGLCREPQTPTHSHTHTHTHEGAMAATNEDFKGVSNCYVFKSRLQEYAQKVGLTTPVYETIKEGPSHEPYFRSTVIVNNVRYDSLPGFFNRKAAEQSAAEVALVELAKSAEANQPVSQPVHETGLCKNLLQEYAQKMSYAMPLYNCKKEETPGRAAGYSCTIDIGGILYIGGTAKTKREAELKAARTALLAIQSSPSHATENQLTVIPCRKRATTVPLPDKTSKTPKPKKERFKRKSAKRKQYRDKKGRIRAENVGSGAEINHQVEAHASVNDEPGIQQMNSEAFTSEVMKDSEIGMSVNYHEKETFAGEGAIALNGQETFENGKSQEMHCKENNHETVAIEQSSVPNAGILERCTLMEMNKQQYDGEMMPDNKL